ncbi:non-heme iron oxygenase ferredoxin subunit [soil metagenome]
MIFKRGLGLDKLASDRSSDGDMPDLETIPEEAFHTVAAVPDIGPGEMKYVEAGQNDEPIVVINVDGEFFALTDTCTHEDASLSDGQIVGDEIECPMHGGAFEIRSGMPTAFPVVVRAKTYPLRVVDGQIQIAILS